MAISTFRVLYHYEKSAYGGKRHEGLGQLQDYVAAAAGDYATLAAVLVSNGRGAPSGYVIVFDSVNNEGVGSLLS